MNSTPELPDNLDSLPQRQNYIEVTVVQLKEVLQTYTTTSDPKENVQHFELVASLMDNLLELGWTREDLRQLIQQLTNEQRT